jgi:hypothetical protein
MFKKLIDFKEGERPATPIHMDLGFDVFSHPDGACLYPKSGEPMDFATADDAIAHAKRVLADHVPSPADFLPDTRKPEK